ncbi:hypothetical protein GWK47_032268 [Chionoecetes opilio]|uniref:DUF243 domain-containing protein n=1 Tax=Chionoecetes opilio TaxID=41210 RepID=A0A8J4YQG2_CHIOP|nr:hypothetical protein GWK47_032268 [Chionoecetes opilio]
MRALLFLAWPLLAWSSPLPDKPSFGGFQPLLGARGSGPSTGFSGPHNRGVVPPAPHFNGPPQHGHQGPPQGHQAPHGLAREPDKTIYVNVPSHEPGPPLPPLAAGPPRKHYKIVFIRAPPPPAQRQAILPPRTEQKTVIYVLHQKQDEHQQQVVTVPHVPHDPEVFFVEYDKPPTAHDLQKLSAGNLDGFSVTAQHTDDDSDEYGGRGDVRAVAEVGSSSLYRSDNVFKRQVGKEAAAAAGGGGVPRPLHS